MARSVALDTSDVRIPTSLSWDGSDAMNQGADRPVADISVADIRRLGPGREVRGVDIRNVVETNQRWGGGEASGWVKSIEEFVGQRHERLVTRSMSWQAIPCPEAPARPGGRSVGPLWSARD